MAATETAGREPATEHQGDERQETYPPFGKRMHSNDPGRRRDEIQSVVFAASDYFRPTMTSLERSRLPEAPDSPTKSSFAV
jgi:hypothetical protein